jgi:hypothetical protein
MAFAQDADPRLFVPWDGTVVDNADPEGLHRVLITIPGFVERTYWAWPITAGGGSAQRGGHIVPAVGADVVVQFLGGDIERPVYQAAHWGLRKDSGHEGPQDVVDAGDQAHLVQSLQVGSLVFTVDERERSGESGKRFTITDTRAEKVVLEYDMELQAWTIAADYHIRLESTGLVKIKGLQVQLNDRLVRRCSRQV